MKQWQSIQIKGILFHLLLWVAVWFFFVYFFSYNSNDTRYITWFSSLLLPITIGITYFMVHDVLIHQRFKWFKHTKSEYLLGLRKAHKIHHKHLGKEEGECFGMLNVPKKYFRKTSGK